MPNRALQQKLQYYKPNSIRKVLENPEHLLHASSEKGLELSYWIYSLAHSQDYYSAQRPILHLN